VIEFIGDAIMALFGAPTPHQDDPLHAVACAAEMHIELDRFCDEYAARGMPPLQQGVGIATGEVIVGNIGSENRMKYGVVGDHVNLAARAESITVGGEVLVSEATRDAIGDRATFRGPIKVKAKGKRAVLYLYALVEVGAPYELKVPAEHRQTDDLVAVDIPVEIFRLRGKMVSDTAEPGRLLRLGQDEAELAAAADLKQFDNLKLRILCPGGESIEDVYAKVQQREVDGDAARSLIRFTSVRESDRERLGVLVSSGG
jgi:adenylate cyclase